MKLLRFLERNFERYVITSTLALIFVTLFVQVLMRYVFRSPLVWSEELSRYLLIWGSLMGTSLAVKESRHISVDILPLVFGVKSVRLFAILAHLGVLAFCVIVIWYSIPLIQSLKMIGQASPSLRIPMSKVYCAVPVGLGFTALRTVQALCLIFMRETAQEAVENA